MALTWVCKACVKAAIGLDAIEEKPIGGGPRECSECHETKPRAALYFTAANWRELAESWRRMDAAARARGWTPRGSEER